jgi:phage-related protein (TIGR01555 family)
MAFPFLDTLANLVSGLGTSKDKRFHDQFTFAPHNRGELDAAYRGDWLSRKIVDIPPHDMTREWRDWKADKADISKIETEEKRLGLRHKVRDTLLYARMYGGAAVMIGFGDNDPAKPSPSNIGRAGIKYIHAVNRYEVTPGKVITDVMSPWFGEPEYWQVHSESMGAVQVHPSRVVAFQGARRLDRDVNAEWWGDSVLEAVYDAVHHAALSNAGIAGLIHEAKLDVIKIPNLSQNLSTQDYSDRLVKRFTLANQMKSLVNALVIDSEEEWDQKQLSFANLPETMREFLNVVSGAADIPATRLLGQSPGGLNATGDSDLRNYYDRIGGDQNVDLTPAMARLDDAMIASALGTRPDGVWYEWASLWQMSDKEEAETAKAKAETTAIYQKTNLVPVDALAKGVQNQIIEDGTYPGLEDALAESKVALEIPPVEEEEDDPADTAKTQQDAQPRTLYVRRNVTNAAEIVKWAKAQGFEKTLKPEDMHVTIAFSRTPIDWMKTGEAWQGELKIAAGGARIVEPLGPKGATVLLFNSSELAWRHRSIIRAGASWDWPDYQPHITITYEAPGLDLSKVEPYRGEIVLGPEIFEEVREGWEKTVEEA